jgi:hypothetical protein
MFGKLLLVNLTLSSQNMQFNVDLKLCAETSDKNQECGIHAILLVAFCVSLRNFLVYLRFARP